MDGMGGRIATGGLLAVQVTSLSTYRPTLRFRPGVRDDGVSKRPRRKGSAVLERAVVEIENHLLAGGWDRPPALFALVRADRFRADDPETAARLGLDDAADDALTPIEQDELPDQPLDELLAGIAWPESVSGCALSQEIVILPPSAEAELSEEQLLGSAAAHPERREARLVVGVLRDGTSAAVLRMRGRDGGDDDLLTGPDLAPNLVEALLETLR
jgi:hypothetical protein